MIRTVRLAVVVAAAALTGVLTTLAFALLGHEVLIARYGEDLT